MSDLQNENEMLKKALGFYADRENYKIWSDTSNNCPTNSVLFDDGFRARTVLKIED